MLNNIHVCFLPPNMTDMLQPMDISVNKPTEDFLEWLFEDWYSHKVCEKLSDESDIQSTNLQPINLGLPLLKELGAKWMVEMLEYFAANPQIIVNGFVKAGIAGALDRKEVSDEQQEENNETESDLDEMESDLDNDLDSNLGQWM